MKAIMYRDFGLPDVLRLEKVEKPTPADDEVLVAVHAAAVNMFDWYMVRGKPFFFRLVLGRGRQKPLGVDLAGVVEAVGRNVTRLKPGDDVFGTGRDKSVRSKRGSFAEYVSTYETMLAVKPRNVTFEQAAGIPVAGLTALQGLRDHGRVERGQKVLINGASGGIGTFAVQIAKSFGAEVTAVCSSSHVEAVRSIGANRVIDYTKEDFTQDDERYDLMLDIAGNHSWSECKRVLDPGGTYVGVGAAGIQHGKRGGWREMGHFLQVRLVSIGGGRNVVAVFVASLKKDDLVLLGDLLVSGRVKAVIERRYDLDGIPEALGYMATGHAGGKIAIEVGQ